MKERPILFSAPMVRSLLNGTKTQTRRVMKPQPEPIPEGIKSRLDKSGFWWACRAAGSMMNVEDASCFGPYGKRGDRLWVRETWRCRGGREYEYQKHQPSIVYRATADILDDVSSEWRPSIFMPRWASRLTLEITEVRVERLNDISEEDAKAEGVTLSNIYPIEYGSPAIWEYKKLWESINGKGSWDKNPWVWVVSFNRV